MINICDNLRGFTTSRPPLVMFMLLLGMFAIALFTIGYLVKVQELRNPDEKDWNQFLSGFKDVQFCMVSSNNETTISQEETDHIGLKPYKEVVSKVQNQLQGDDKTSSTTSPNTRDIVMVSVPFWVKILPTVDFVNIPHNVSHLSTSMNGKQLGLQGDNANTEFNVTFKLPFQWNSSLCTSNDVCKVVRIQTCIELEAPATLFPSRKSSPQCEVENSTGGVENYFKMVSKKKSEVRPTDIVCDSYPSLTVDHHNDPTLTIMLTLQDRSAINLHLLHTTYFLFIMIIIMMCYALVRGKPHTGKYKNKHYSKVPTQI